MKTHERTETQVPMEKTEFTAKCFVHIHETQSRGSNPPIRWAGNDSNTSGEFFPSCLPNHTGLEHPLISLPFNLFPINNIEGDLPLIPQDGLAR